MSVEVKVSCTNCCEDIYFYAATDEAAVHAFKTELGRHKARCRFVEKGEKKNPREAAGKMIDEPTKG